MLEYGMRTFLSICIISALGLSLAPSNSLSESGKLVVEEVNLKFANKFYPILSPAKGTFIVVERIDAINEISNKTHVSHFSAHDKYGDLELYLQRGDIRRYSNLLYVSDITSMSGSQGIALLPGYTLEAKNPGGANKLIISYRVFSQ